MKSGIKNILKTISINIYIEWSNRKVQIINSKQYLLERRALPKYH